MNDVLVEVVCIATIKKYEFWLPKKGLIVDAIKKIAEEIMLFENNDSIYSGEAMNDLVLVVASTGDILNKSYTINDSGIMSGDKLIVV